MKEKLTRGVLWLTGAKVMVNLLALCSTFILARILVPEDFGLVALVATMLEVLYAVTELSLAASLIHHANPTEDHFHTAWTMNIIRAAVLGGGFALASPWVAAFYGDERLTAVMCVVGLSVFLSGFNNPKVVTLTRQLVFRQEFIVLVAQKLVGVMVSISVALIYKSYWALVAGMLCTNVAGVVTSYVVVRYRPRPCLRHVKDLLSFSVWLSAGQIVNTLNWKLDHLIIGARMGTRSLGLYTVGDNLASLPTRETIGPIEQTLFPGLRTVADDPARLTSVYLRTQALISAIALPVGVLFALQAEAVVRLVLGEKWMQAVVVVQILASVFALQTMASPVRPLALAKGETRLLFLRDLAGFAMRVPLIAAAAYWGSLLTVLQARALTGVLAVGLNMTVVRTILGLGYLQQLRNTERSLVSVLVMALAFWQLAPAGPGPQSAWWHAVLQLATQSACGLLIYGTVHFLLWQLRGRPAGAENEFSTLVTKIRGRLGNGSGE